MKGGFGYDSPREDDEDPCEYKSIDCQRNVQLKF
jgi:hypothetical protein